MKKLLLVTFFLAAYTLNAQAVDTFEDVAKIFETKCAGCHEGNNPQGKLNLVQPLDDLYTELFETEPTNPRAKEMDYKLVDAGYPTRSFLYRKIDGGLYHDINLENAEGKLMPTNGNKLTDAEKELVRQWILFGAPKEGEVVKKDILEEYYTEGGVPALERPDPPAEGEGFQLYLGRIFLEPKEEREYIYKYELKNPEPIEINRIDTRMNDQSHHFLFFKFDENKHQDEDEGLEEVTTLSSITGEAIAITNDTRMIGGWAYSSDIVLPEGTAYNWRANEVLKFNYHIKNYSETSIAPIELYVNVYTQAVGTASHEMRSDFLLYNPLSLVIEPGENSYEWVRRNFDGANSNDDVHLWLLGAHTHQLGTDFDIYQRMGDGSYGEQIYEGFYNFDYSFDQGFYDYAEPPMRIFDELYTIRAGDGLIMTADYNNPGTQSVRFGLTTADEMFGLFIQYLVGDISDLSSQWTVGIENETSANVGLEVFPNPTTGPATISYHLEEATTIQLEVFNTVGQRVANVVQGNQTPGDYQYSLNQNLTAGVYMVQLRVGEELVTKKLVVTE